MKSLMAGLDLELIVPLVAVFALGVGVVTAEVRDRMKDQSTARR